jgi:type VI secretion system Hcp family effector
VVAGSLSGQSVVNEVKAIDQALVALPILGRRIAGSGAWHSRSSVAPSRPTAKRTRCWGARRSKSGKPITLTVEIDKGTPLLYNVLVNNENLKTVKIQYWSTGSVQAGKAAAATGKEYQHYTITLTNANIASIDYRQPHTKNAEMARLMEYTDVSFVYEKIEWSWTDGGITAEDSWESPVV